MVIQFLDLGSHKKSQTSVHSANAETGNPPHRRIRKRGEGGETIPCGLHLWSDKLCCNNIAEVMPKFILLKMEVK
jgi:hypothetical protein